MRQYSKLLAWLLTVALLVCCTSCGDRKQAEVSAPNQADLTTSDENTQTTISTPKEPEAEPEPEKVSISGDIRVGETLTFGSFDQDSNGYNGKEPIEWIVLAKENNRILVISQYALIGQPFHTTQQDVTWETCTLRSWLNNEFIHEAFTQVEQATIPMVELSQEVAIAAEVLVDGWRETHYRISKLGTVTQDKVFLLSLTEAYHYFGNREITENDTWRSETDTWGRQERLCEVTNSGRNSGVKTDYQGEITTCCWWLRTDMKREGRDDSVYMATIHYNGMLGDEQVDDARRAVRPAMWLEIDS